MNGHGGKLEFSMLFSRKNTNKDASVCVHLVSGTRLGAHIIRRPNQDCIDIIYTYFVHDEPIMMLVLITVMKDVTR